MIEVAGRGEFLLVPAIVDQRKGNGCIGCSLGRLVCDTQCDNKDVILIHPEKYDEYVIARVAAKLS